MRAHEKGRSATEVTKAPLRSSGRVSAASNAPESNLPSIASASAHGLAAFVADLCALPVTVRGAVPELTDDTVLLFDGTVCRFGDLMRADKKTVCWNPEAECYEGGYGI